MSEFPVRETTTARDAPAAVALSRFFAALANPARAAIIEQLSTGPSNVRGLQAALGLPQPLVSQHLKVLRQAGAVSMERHGRMHYYRLASGHVRAVREHAVRLVQEQSQAEEAPGAQGEPAPVRAHLQPIPEQTDAPTPSDQPQAEQLEPGELQDADLLDTAPLRTVPAVLQEIAPDQPVTESTETA